MNLDKLETKKQWNATPCGTGDYLSHLEEGSLEWFDEIRRSRYEDTDQWMKRTIDFSSAKGKKLLEVGHGIGSDLLTFCENGAEVYGIDITERHHELAKRNFELHNQPCVLKLCDASSIDFPDNFFDVVYSIGVLHHTPDTIRCVGEIYRVLKPDGKLILALYHTYSAYHIFSKIIYSGIFKGELWKFGYKGLMSKVEYGADGINLIPLVKTYGSQKLRFILEDFSELDIKISHLKREHIPRVGKYLPLFFEDFFSNKLGWYIICMCRK